MLTSIQPWAIAFLITTILQCLTLCWQSSICYIYKNLKLPLQEYFKYILQSNTGKNGFNHSEKQSGPYPKPTVYETLEDYYNLYAFKSTKMIILLLFHVFFIFQICHNKEIRGKKL